MNDIELYTMTTQDSHSRSADVRHRRWTLGEDTLLRAFKEAGMEDWVFMSEQFSDRSRDACMSRWHKYLKHLWPEEEIETLESLFEKHGLTNEDPWQKIANDFRSISGTAGRGARECKEQLKLLDQQDSSSSGDWSPQEEAKLFQLRAQGKDWDEIAQWISSYSGTIRQDRDCRSYWLDNSPDGIRRWFRDDGSLDFDRHIQYSPLDNSIDGPRSRSVAHKTPSDIGSLNDPRAKMEESHGKKEEAIVWGQGEGGKGK